MSDRAHTTTERPFQPEIPRSRFSLGMGRYPTNLEELRLGRFCDGQQTLPTPVVGLHRGHFAEGQERFGDGTPRSTFADASSEGIGDSTVDRMNKPRRPNIAHCRMRRRADHRLAAVVLVIPTGSPSVRPSA